MRTFKKYLKSRSNEKYDHTKELEHTYSPLLPKWLLENEKEVWYPLTIAMRLCVSASSYFSTVPMRRVLPLMQALISRTMESSRERKRSSLNMQKLKFFFWSGFLLILWNPYITQILPIPNLKKKSLALSTHLCWTCLVIHGLWELINWKLTPIHFLVKEHSLKFIRALYTVWS